MTPPLAPSLEDYLETIYLLQKGKNEARVRDIATSRGVKASSVPPALKRLSEMGLLAYVQRESIQLTEEGKIAARRVYAKHILLFQFFHDILGMDAEKAREEACGLEHALSDDGMDRFARFFESRTLCTTDSNDPPCALCTMHENIPHTTLDQIQDGSCVTVAQIRASGPTRQAILDMGILPNVTLTRRATNKDKILIEIEHHELTLSLEQIKAIVVTF